MRTILVFVIRCYQRLVSPLLPPVCKYEPTCSAYAIEAIRKKGIARGCLMAAWRVLRCNPFAKGGYDPVEPPQDHAEDDDETTPS
jgi:putative membrane protein insertion efficiency factor